MRHQRPIMFLMFGSRGSFPWDFSKTHEPQWAAALTSGGNCRRAVAARAALRCDPRCAAAQAVPLSDRAAAEIRRWESSALAGEESPCRKTRLLIPLANLAAFALPFRETVAEHRRSCPPPAKGCRRYGDEEYRDRAGQDRARALRAAPAESSG